MTWQSFNGLSPDPVVSRARELDTTNPEAARKSANVAIRATVVFRILITSDLVTLFRYVGIKKVFEHATNSFKYEKTRKMTGLGYPRSICCDGVRLNIVALVWDGKRTFHTGGTMN